MCKLLKTTIIGTGKVAKSLAGILCQKNMLYEVYGRNLDRALQIIPNNQVIKTTTSLDFSRSKSNAFIICVSDSSIAQVAQEIILPPQAILIHTSGAIDLDVLTNQKSNCAILYPIQTFTEKAIKTLENIPLLIEANNENTFRRVEKLAKSLSKRVFKTSQQERERLHIAAVFASNFTNRIIHAAQATLNHTNLPFDLLEPLIHQSINNALLQGAQKTLTGPAKRNDQITIDKHVSLLSLDPNIKALYQALTQYTLTTNQA